MKLLIAYDGSSGAEAALEDLRFAGLPVDLEARVIAAADVFLPPPPGDVPTFAEQPPAVVERAREEGQHAVDDALALATQACEQLHTMFHDWDVHAEARADSPAWAIIKEADAWQADLVVVGCRNRSLLGRWLLGSVSHTVLTEARRSVRVARRRDRDAETPLRLLLGVDGSPGAAAAIQAMATRSWPSGTLARLVVALDDIMAVTLSKPHPAIAAWIREEDSDALAWVGRMVEALGAPLRAAGLAVSSVIKEGDPKRLLLEEAEAWQADTICLGARGLSSVERFLLGSVSTTIATDAPCSVEVIHLPQTPGSAQEERIYLS